MRKTSRYNTISFKISLLVGSATFLLVAILIGYSVLQVRERALKGAIDNALATASGYAGRVTTPVNKALDVSRTLSKVLLSVKREEEKNNLTREQVNGMMKSYLESDESIFGISTLWEPNAFDGKDHLYKNTKGHDETGRYIPYYARSNHQIVLEACVGYENELSGTYYLLPKRTGQEHILDPYVYAVGGQDVLMVSVVTPIMHKGRFVGTTGTDFTIEWLQGMVDKDQKGIFNGLGQLYIISHNGTIAAASGKEELVGKEITSVFEDYEAQSKKLHKASYKIENGVLKTFVPMFFGQTKTPWQVCITVPVAELTKEAEAEAFKMLLIGLGFLIGFVLLVVWVISSITKSITEAKNAIQAIAQGDLTVQIEVKSKDEVGELLQYLQMMITKLKEVIGHVSSASTNIASASEQMSSSAQQVSQGANEQAASAEEVSSSMEQMASNIEQNSDNAQQTETIALKAAVEIKEGSQAVNKTVESMKEIAEKTSIISEIARQTNLLALNAAVEAARAGEHGKGFAVVAAEVRKLAERSGLAAAEIEKLSKSSVIIAEKSGKLLEQIVPSIEKTARLVQEISAASLEQNTGAMQVNGAIQQLNHIIQQNAAASEEMAASSEELSNQAEHLLQAVSFFKAEQGEKVIRKANYARKTNLSASLDSTLSRETAVQSDKAGKGLSLELSDSKTKDSLDHHYETYM